MRLNRYIASSGFCSRRKADLLIEEGRVKVNDKVAQVGLEVNENDIVKVDDKKIKVKENKVYYMLNKPKGYLTANSDEKRKVVTSLVRVRERIFPIGRLDYDTEGLLILTNDGDLFNRLIHPRAEVFKKYYVVVKGTVPEEELKKMEKGIFIREDKHRTLPCNIENINYEKELTTLEMSIREGRKRQIRRMFSSIGYDVIYLQRIAIGNIKLGDLPLGKFRRLTDREINYLEKL